MKKIAIEEHFYTEEYLAYLRSRQDWPRLEAVEDEEHHRFERLWYSPGEYWVREPNFAARTLDIGAGRLKDMDEAGIHMQVLSLAHPGVEAFDVHGVPCIGGQKPFVGAVSDAVHIATA